MAVLAAIVAVLLKVKKVFDFLSAVSSPEGRETIARYVLFTGIADIFSQNVAPATFTRAAIKHFEFASRISKDPLGTILNVIGYKTGVPVSIEGLLDGLLAEAFSNPAIDPGLKNAIKTYFDTKFDLDFQRHLTNVANGLAYGFSRLLWQTFTRIADPIVLHRGEFERVVVDLQVNGAGIDFILSRTYGSRVAFSGPLGPNWDHNYNLKLRQENEHVVAMLTGQLAEYAFIRHPQFGNSEFDYYVPPNGVHDVLVPNGSSSFLLKKPQGLTYEFMPAQQQSSDNQVIHLIDRIEDRFGNYLQFSYSSEDRLDHVLVNSTFRKVRFFYDEQGRLDKVMDHTDRSVVYGYNDWGFLDYVSGPVPEGEKPTRIERYDYTAVGETLKLARVWDWKGRIVVENEYEQNPLSEFFGYVIRQCENKGETNIVYESLRGEADPNLPLYERPTIRILEYKRNGHKVEHILNEYGNELYKRERYVEGCGIREAVTLCRYNADGEIIAKIDPDGTITQYLFGRDHLIDSFQYPDLEHMLGDVPQKDRMSFGNLLAKVTRGKRISHSGQPFTADFWEQYLPSVKVPDSPKDFVIQYHYDRNNQLLISKSDPRHTISAKPVPAESSDPQYQEYQRHLTHFEYGAAPYFEHKRTVLPNRTRPSAITGSTIVNDIDKEIEYDTNWRPIKRVDANGYEWFSEYFPQTDDPTERFKEGFLQRQLVPHVDWVLNSEMPNILEITKTGAWQASANSILSSGSIDEHIIIKVEGVRIALYQSKSLNDTLSNNSKVRVCVDGNIQPNGNIQPIWNQANENVYIINNLSPGIHEIEVRDTLGSPVSLGRIRSHTAIEYQVDELGQVLEETDARGNVTVNAYNVLGQKIKVTQGPSITHFEYDPQGNLVLERTEWHDEQGNPQQPEIAVIKRYQYDVAGNLLSETVGPEKNGAKRTKHHRYDAEDNLRTAKNPRGVTTFFHYDALNRQTRVDRAACSKDYSATRIMYNNAGQVLFRKNPRGAIYLNGYYTARGEIRAAIDTLGRVFVETDPLGHLVVTDYDKLNNATVVRRFQLSSDDNNRFDGNYEMLSRIEKEYDEHGDVRHVTSAVFETPILTTNPKIPNQADAEFNIEVNNGSVKRARTEFHLDAIGNRIAIRNPDGGIQNQQFDGQRRVFDETDPEGRRVFRIFDGNGNVTRAYTFEPVRDPQSDNVLHYEVFVQLFKYDELNREIALIDSYGNRWEKRYDSLGNLTKTIDPLSNVIRFKYNAFGERIAEIKELTQTGIGGAPAPTELISQYQYDKNGNILTIIDPAQRRTEFQYDALDRQIESWFAVSANGPHEYRSYDRASNLISITNRNGLIKNLQYDSLDRHFRTDIDAASVAPANALSIFSPTFLSFQYDAAGNIIQHQNRYCTVDIKRDSRGLPLFESIRIQDITGAPAQQEISRSFDLSGRRKTITYSSGRKLEYTYDKMGHVISIQNTVNGSTIAAYNYVGQRLSQVNYGNGLSLSLRHDGRGFVYERFVSTEDDTVLWRNQNLRDGAGYTRLENRTTGAGELSRKFSYDSIYRLTHYDNNDDNNVVNWFDDHTAMAPPQIPDEPLESNGQSLINGHVDSLSLPSGPFVFEFDEMGNRLETREPGLAAINSEPNELNQYEEVNGTTWNYDLNGNLREDDEFTFVYDLNDALQEIIQKNTNTQQVVYYRDALGRVIAEKGTDTAFRIYDGNMPLVEFSRNNEKEFTAGHLSNVVVHAISSGDDFWLTQDGLDSIRLLTNNIGEIVSIPAYRPFGEPEDGELALSPFHFSFAGMWHTPGIPFYHSQARSYRVDLGRHLQRDPAGFVDGLNLYTYVRNNPIIYSDPSGYAPGDIHIDEESGYWAEETADGGFDFHGGEEIDVFDFGSIDSVGVGTDTIYSYWEDPEVYARLKARGGQPLESSLIQPAEILLLGVIGVVRGGVVGAAGAATEASIDATTVPGATQTLKVGGAAVLKQVAKENAVIRQTYHAAIAARPAAPGTSFLAYQARNVALAEARSQMGVLPRTLLTARDVFKPRPKWGQLFFKYYSNLKSMGFTHQEALTLADSQVYLSAGRTSPLFDKILTFGP